MGVTIHFEGKLKNENNYDLLIKNAYEFINQYELESTIINEDNKFLSRVKDERDWDYTGSVKGLKIMIHDNCDPLLLEFDTNLYIQEFIKTQFVGADAHIIICEYLESISSFFEIFVITDEGEYYETKDKLALENHIDTVDKLIEEKLKLDSNLSGPVRNQDGRIIDLVENK